MELDEGQNTTRKTTPASTHHIGFDDREAGRVFVR